MTDPSVGLALPHKVQAGLFVIEQHVSWESKQRQAVFTACSDVYCTSTSPQSVPADYVTVADSINNVLMEAK